MQAKLDYMPGLLVYMKRVIAKVDEIEASYVRCFSAMLHRRKHLPISLTNMQATSDCTLDLLV